ncbi:MAG: hypothetical protein ABSA14_06830 [Acidimicrobiales bacterium]|jgi:hypothetical protein
MQRDRRKWRGAAVAAVLVALGGAAPATAATASRTRIDTEYPWTSAGKLDSGLKVAGTVKGTCWTSSIAVSAGDAYRCMTSASLIYDPCFAPETKSFKQLACMASPWGKVTRLDLTASIPDAAKHPNGKPWVWAVQLANGVRCITATGTGTVVDKVALNYYCIPGTGWASIPDRTAEPWTVRYARSYQSKTLETESLTTAWY